MENKRLAYILRTKRCEKGLTQLDLAKALTEMTGGEIEITVSNISKWEAGVTPGSRRIAILADFFDTTVGYLKGDSASDEVTMAYKYDSDVLINAYDLDFYNGMPVWVEDTSMVSGGRYAIVNSENSTLRFGDGSYRTYEDLAMSGAVIKATPDAAAFKLRRRSGQYLLLSRISDKQKVWVEVFGQPEGIAERLRGYYTYFKNEGYFGREGSLPLPDAQYGRDFVAFPEADAEI